MAATAAAAGRRCDALDTYHLSTHLETKNCDMKDRTDSAPTPDHPPNLLPSQPLDVEQLANSHTGEALKPSLLPLATSSRFILFRDYAVLGFGGSGGPFTSILPPSTPATKTTTTATASVAAARGTRSVRVTGLSKVHPDSTSVQLRLVERVNSQLRLILLGEGHEAEAPVGV